MLPNHLQTDFVTEDFRHDGCSNGRKKNCCYRSNFNLMCLQNPKQFDCFCFLLSSSSNFTAFSAHAASWHTARLGANTNFILLQSGQHPQYLLAYIIPPITMLCHQILSLAMGSFFPIVHPSPPAILVSHFVCSLVEQLYLKEVYFC